MHRRVRWLLLASLLLLLTTATPPAYAVFDVVWGSSWDGVPLQDIVDNFLGSQFPGSYNPGDIDVFTNYEGYLPGDADLSPTPYWEDSAFDGLLVQELAGYDDNNIFGWYEIGFPQIDDFNDGVIFEGPASPGATQTVTFSSPIRFGFWLNPNGELDSRGAPEPEVFYTDRTLNDVGPDGSGTLHGPENGDPQCMIYNVSQLYGRAAYILAWEDLDYGLEVRLTPGPSYTDNDFNDMVVLILASSPVPTESSSWGQVKSLYGSR